VCNLWYSVRGLPEGPSPSMITSRPPGFNARNTACIVRSYSRNSCLWRGMARLPVAVKRFVAGSKSSAVRVTASLIERPVEPALSSTCPLRAVVAFHTRKQMPERQRIAHAGFGQHGCERIRFVARKIKTRQRLLKLLRGVFKIRRAEPSIRLRPAERARRDKRFAPVARQRHPARCHVQQTAARFVHVERVSATEINRDGGRRFDLKEPRRRDDAGVKPAAREREPVFVRAGLDQPHARARINFNLSERTNLNQRSRARVSLQPFAGMQTRCSDNRTRFDHRLAGEAHDFPGRLWRAEEIPRRAGHLTPTQRRPAQE